MCEVKSYSFSIYQLTCLMNVFAEDFSQSSLKQMCAAMVSHYSKSVLLVYLEISLLTCCERTLCNSYL